MIYTLTLNTAIDMNIFSAPLHPQVVNRAHRTEYCPNGKGVNVALVLQHFAKPAHVLGIFGGFTGHYIVQELKKKKLAVTPAWVNAPTRINVFINDGENEFKLLNPGTFIDDDCKQQVIDQLERLTDADCLVISGSLPPGIESRFYAEILTLCQAQNIPVILDISDPSLKDMLTFKPLLIKPNNDEVAAIFGLPVTNHHQAKTAMQAMHALGAQNILLTLGADGMYFSDGQNDWFCTAPKIELVSSACAGDAALGAFLSVWLSGGSVEQAMKLASATGADVASSAGLGRLANIPDLLLQVQTEKR
ncbi:1-phosphofructokinase [Erwinia endophytica]|uniref:1-phosphofructokinase n=1 Tax=Erwinia endophytica TaxID=1563158 RepID=UPI001265F99E|nr:1-phosphofructokinase [Erwinia endophytica]KAB8307335.1 1-phosphofructokinase [Erwinia endophytica]